jgi:subtilase family serine protease
MGLPGRSRRVGVTALLGAGLVTLTAALPALALPSTAAPSAAAPTTAARGALARSGWAAVGGNLPASTDRIIGTYTNPRMTVEVALAPRHPAGLSARLLAVSDPANAAYEHWLAPGVFDAQYAPTPATTGAVAAYLRGAGLVVGRGSSPFLLTATGSSALVTAAFHTTLRTFRNGQGTRYFSNSAPVDLPTGLSGVLGVIGLSDTVREHSDITAPTGPDAGAARSGAAARSGGAPWSCQAAYPTKAQLFALVNDGVGFPMGYGGSPGCHGLTPAQTNSIYGATRGAAPAAAARERGRGVSLALFELSAYQTSDIDTWARTFYGPTFRPPLDNVIVDGGSLHTVCPPGDTCPETSEYYADDIEVDADIEMDLTIAPAARRITVYDAPSDFTGQTSLDEYNLIARSDADAVVSSSWGACENDLTLGYVQAENVIFEQLALQGQSMFSAAGDAGAFDCVRSDGSSILNVQDPATQPWVTGVGGTSLGHDNPGLEVHPSYPIGAETVWNVDGLCNPQPADGAEGGEPGSFWCDTEGAGGGGSSQYWGRPQYQQANGVTNVYTTYANGTTQCALAPLGRACREVPDVSANADMYTGFAEYCTGGETAPYSACGAQSPTGGGNWFPVGGTSLSSPLWSAIVADRDSYQGRRSGNVNPLLYELAELSPATYFHDITERRPRTSTGPAANDGPRVDNAPWATDNGLFPVTPGYDEATGLGTPRMANLITMSG